MAEYGIIREQKVKYGIIREQKVKYGIIRERRVPLTVVLSNPRKWVDHENDKNA